MEYGKVQVYRQIITLEPVAEFEVTGDTYAEVNKQIGQRLEALNLPEYPEYQGSHPSRTGERLIYIKQQGWRPAERIA